MPKQPNILLITTDTQRWDTLHGLIARSHRGGPIARCAVAHMKGVSGLDAEERLNPVCRAADGLG
jgi:hypothetical protein